LFYDWNQNGYFDQPDYDNYLDRTIFAYSHNTEGIYEEGATISVDAELTEGIKYELEMHLYGSAYTEALE